MIKKLLSILMAAGILFSGLGLSADVIAAPNDRHKPAHNRVLKHKKPQKPKPAIKKKYKKKHKFFKKHKKNNIKKKQHKKIKFFQKKQKKHIKKHQKRRFFHRIFRRK